MHTTKSISSADFSIKINEHPASIADVFPGFNKQDRIGIVVRRPGGSAGVSGLLMAAITSFYDFHRSQLGYGADKLWIYPDFFIFHIDNWHMDHYWMDIWPPNKEVIVEDDPEQILEAINDRGITRLIVEDIPAATATFLRETVSSANKRIISALAYSPNGRVQHGDVSVRNCSNTENYVLDSLKRTKGISTDLYNQFSKNRQSLVSDGGVMETYRRITVTDALNMLTDSTELGPTTKHYISLLE
ncbi:hypothetical protein [Bacillus sp. 1NLA3E]|uniref:hypothetical protein n=1 Tax=Bacillus sp. 1NLA3E TaxID=666686 RepID=UPI000247E880|nr:hypothetical protein [Bacillus sp. 1NLA3E]AGK53298.1 hypothetical protein B1NLA3E_07680 [Bacillus sp. 1NLA3E]